MWRSSFLVGMRRFAAMAILLAAGCPQPASPPAAPETPAHDAAAHQHSGHGDHAGSHAGHSAHGPHAGHAPLKPGPLLVRTTPEIPVAGEPIDLALTIPDDKDQPIREFDVVHEKKAHLIIVREGLDEFAHVHPEIDAAGTLTTRDTFPQPGRYQLFVDYQPAGGKPSLATALLEIPGESVPAPKLVPTGQSEITDGEVRARLEVVPSGDGVRIRFHLTDAAGKPLADLQPYLGAMGHLVVIGANKMEYLHAHPLGETAPPADGVVEFETQLPGTGLFKAWGQFQHQGRIVTIPAVIAVEAKP